MFQESPASLRRIESMMTKMLKTIIISNQQTMTGFEHKDRGLFEQARVQLLTLESDADAIDDAIVATFANGVASLEELHINVTYLKVVNELVRIGIGTRKYSRRIETYCMQDCVLSPFGSLILPLHRSALNALELILSCFNNLHACDVEANYRKVMVEENKNDDLYGIAEQEIMNLITQEGERSVDFVKVLATLRKLERICDRAVNIANLLIFVKTGGKLSTYSS